MQTRTTWLRATAGLVAMSAAVVVMAPPNTNAFSLLGFSLGLDQRDVRVFDNFLDAQANDNTTPDPNWPGYTGAPLAIWKAVSEWGSELHGDGSGDPSQPFDIGSGGANFDVTWQGLATSAGPTTGNTVSATPSLGGGVVVLTETGPNGWRMQFNDDWTWDDDPVGPAPGTFDIQGIMTHEFGHALGLGHSNSNCGNCNNGVTGASTMCAFVCSDSVVERSLQSDDRAGIQAIYGAKGASKPHVAAIVGSASLAILGAHFDATSNEVWFTRAGSNPTGDPLKVGGVASTGGGTRIELALPAGAGPGDVLVRVPGPSGAALSNAYPFDPGCAPATYCTAKANSLGCAPAIAFSGGPSASAGAGFLVTAGNVLNNKSGLLFYGTTGALASPFQGGVLCVRPPIRRTAVQDSGGNPPPNDCSGAYALDFNAVIAAASDPDLVAGAQVWMQYWSRDPGFAPPDNTGLTNALAATICP